MKRGRPVVNTHRLSFTFNLDNNNEKQVHDFIESLPKGTRNRFAIDAVIEKIAREGKSNEMESLKDLIKSTIIETLKTIEIKAPVGSHTFPIPEEGGTLGDFNLSDDEEIDDSVLDIFG